MYQIRCLFIHVNIIPDPTRTFKNGKGPHLPKIGDGPGPTFQKSTTGSDFPQIDNDCLFRRSGPAVDIWKVRVRCLFGKSRRTVDFWKIRTRCLFGRSGPVVDFWKVRARCVFGRSEPVVFLEGPGPLSIFGRFGPVVNIWTVQARCRYLEGQGSLSIFGKSGLVVFWKVRARCLFGKSRPVVDFWKVRARCFFGKSGPVVFLVDSGWAPGGPGVGRSVRVGSCRVRWGFGSTPREFRVGSEWFPGRFWVVSGSAPGGLCGALGRFRWVPGRIRRVPGGFRVGSGWFPGSCPGPLRVGSRSTPGGLRVGSGQVGLDLAHAIAAQNGEDFILIREPNKNRARGHNS
jgi:hypothetical protein